MELLFAFHNINFAKQLKSSFEENEKVKVVDIVSSEEDLLKTMAKQSNIQGVLLTTDIATKLNDKRLELLVDILAAAREQFPEVTFTILSNEKIGHPLLAELVEMGIYNIFLKNKEDLTVQKMLNSFDSPFSFNVAVKYRQVDGSIPWRRNLQKQSTLKVEIHKNEDSSIEVEPITNVSETVTSNKKQINWLDLKNRIPKFKTSAPKVQNESHKNTEWVIDDLHTVISKTTEKIIGTVVIGITSVAPHLGSTHTAISASRYLSELGHMVALVEGNYSQDYDRIHSLYEGEKKQIFHESHFPLYGVEHFKYRENQNLAEIFSVYEYVVLDLGYLPESMYEDEFRRAHVKCVICSADEWKYHWIEEFNLNYDNMNHNNFLIPGATNKSIRDLKERLDYQSIYPFPIQDNPYHIPTKEAEEIFNEVIGEFINGTGQMFSKSTLIWTSVISITVTILIFITYVNLR